MAEPATFEILDAIRGENFLAIQAVAAVLDGPVSKRPNARLVVAREGEKVAVLLADAADRLDPKKYLGAEPGRTTVLTEAELKAAVAQIEKVENVDNIRAGSLAAIRAGHREFLKREPDTKLADYNIQVVRDGESTVAIFRDKDAQPGDRGHNRKRPGFEVELKGPDREVVRANYIR